MHARIVILVHDMSSSHAFHQNILYGFQVMNWRQNCTYNNQREITLKLYKPELWFL